MTHQTIDDPSKKLLRYAHTQEYASLPSAAVFMLIALRYAHTQEYACAPV